MIRSRARSPPGNELSHPCSVKRPAQLTVAAWVAQHRHAHTVTGFQFGIAVDEHAGEIGYASAGEFQQGQIAQVAVVALIENQHVGARSEEQTSELQELM